MYRAEKKSMQILLSSTQAGPGRKVKQEQEEISRNHIPRLFLGSVRSKTFTGSVMISEAPNGSVPYLNQVRAKAAASKSVLCVAVTVNEWPLGCREERRAFPSFMSRGKRRIDRYIVTASFSAWDEKHITFNFLL